MTLRASLLHELEKPRLSVDQRAELRCEVARDFENRGEYIEARKVLGDHWNCIGEHPKVEGLQRSTAADVLLRAGVLTGWIGSKNRLTEAQEIAKDLISESRAIYEARHAKKKIAEAQTEIALCYWRTGEINEAQDSKNLGTSYQELHYMLATRHKDLLKYRTPIRRRPPKQ